MHLRDLKAVSHGIELNIGTRPIWKLLCHSWYHWTKQTEAHFPKLLIANMSSQSYLGSKIIILVGKMELDSIRCFTRNGTHLQTLNSHPVWGKHTPLDYEHR